MALKVSLNTAASIIVSYYPYCEYKCINIVDVVKIPLHVIDKQLYSFIQKKSLTGKWYPVVWYNVCVFVVVGGTRKIQKKILVSEYK